MQLSVLLLVILVGVVFQSSVGTYSRRRPVSRRRRQISHYRRDFPTRVPTSASPADLESTKDHLQTQIGASPTVTIESFNNWAGNQVIEHVFKVSPTNSIEIRRVVLAARQLGLKIRCTGGGRSWGPLFPDENQVLLDMSQVTRTPSRLTFNQDSMTVTAVASVTQGEALQFYLVNGIAAKAGSQPHADTLGGTISTASHGSNIAESVTVTDYVRELKFIDGLGNDRTISTTDDPDYLKAASAVGLFGAVYEVTYEVQPAALIDKNVDLLKVNILSDGEALKSLVESHRSVATIWVPFSSVPLDESLRFHKDIKWVPENDELAILFTDLIESPSPVLVPQECGLLLASSLDFFKEISALSAVSDVFTDSGRSWPIIAKVGAQLLKQAVGPINVPITFPLASAFHLFDVDGSRLSGPVGDSISFEMSIPIGDDFENAPLLQNIIINQIKRYARRGKYPMAGITHRFLKNSISFASQVFHTEENIIYMAVDFSGHLGSPNNFYAILADIWNDILIDGRLPKPKIHLGKIWQKIPNHKRLIQSGMRDQLNDIKRVRNTLNADPENIFTNQALRNMMDL